MQSWGVRARWDVRDSALEPTRSGVIGLLACALGYGRDDARISDRLDSRLLIGVRVEHQGSTFDDYHTITGFLPIAQGGYRHLGGTAKSLARLQSDSTFQPATVLSKRRYLADAAFLIVIATRNSQLLDGLLELADALRAPQWPIYLGRRSCPPTRPVFESLTDAYEGIEDALRRHPWSCRAADGAIRKPSHDPLRVVFDSDDGLAERDDRPPHGTSRVFGRRKVKVSWVDFPGAETVD